MSALDDLLNEAVDSKTAGYNAAKKVGKEAYGQLMSHRNIVSYSMLQNLHECPRKYQLRRMQAEANTLERRESPTFAFGHAVGAGVAVFDQTQDRRQAIWAAFLAWDIDLFADEENRHGKRTGKSFHDAIWAIYEWENFYQNETDLADYEVIHVEANLVVDFNNGWYYVGHVDELLRNKYTGRLRVKENKTTALLNVDPAMYSNSDQALSYAIIVDMLGEADYDVMYTVYSAGQQKWLQFDFVKNASKKAEWLQDQLLVHQQLEGYQEVNFFPKRGSACMNFGRRCEYYENCDFSSQKMFGKRFDELPTVETVAEIHAIEHVDFSTTLDEIVQRQKERL